MRASDSTLALLYTAICVFSSGVLLNCLVLATIARSSRLWTPVNLMVAALAVIGNMLLGPDLCVCCYNLYHRQSAGSNYIACNVQAFASLISGSADLGVLTIVSYNRYDVILNRAVWSVKSTLLYVSVVTGICFFHVVWICTGIQQMVEQSNGAYCLMDWRRNHDVGILPTLLIIVLGWGMTTFCLVCYCRVYKAYRAHTDTMKQASTQIQKEMRLSVNVSLILVSFVIFWTPYLALIVYSVSTGSFVNPIYDATALALVATNACVTPMLFVLINQQLRRSLVELLTCQRRRPSLASPTNSHHSHWSDRSTRVAPDNVRRTLTAQPSVQLHSALHSPVISQRAAPMLQIVPRSRYATPLSTHQLLEYPSSVEDSAAVHPVTDIRGSYQSTNAAGRSSSLATPSPTLQHQRLRPGRSSDFRLTCSPLRIDELPLDAPTVG